MAVTADRFDRRALIYGKLDRRNRIIGLLRWAVPIAGLALAAGLIFEIVIANLGSNYTIEGLTIEDGRVVIADPRYGGQFGDNNSYEVAAAEARVAMDNPELIELQSATITTVGQNDSRMEGVAPFAIIDVRAQTVTIDGELTTLDSSGVRAELYSTQIDWQNQSMVSQGPVRIDFPDGGQILSERLTYSAEDEVWRFASAQFDRPATEEDAATRITADQLNYDANAGTAAFTGNARAEQDQTVVEANTLAVQFAQGDSAEFERVEANGAVNVRSGGQTATGDRGVYDPVTETMNLTGNVRVTGEEGAISADQLSIDIAAGSSSFTGQGGNRVTGDFSPPGADRTRIEANRLLDLREDNRTEFSGNAVIRMADQTVSTDRFIVHYQPENPNQIAYYEMLGSVRVRSQDQSATGNRGIYDPDTRYLRLTGDVRVTNAGGTVSAPELRVNLATNVFEFSGPGDGSRVTGVFSPDNPPQTQ